MAPELRSGALDRWKNTSRGPKKQLNRSEGFPSRGIWSLGAMGEGPGVWEVIPCRVAVALRAKSAKNKLKKLKFKENRKIRISGMRGCVRLVEALLTRTGRGQKSFTRGQNIKK